MPAPIKKANPWAMWPSMSVVVEVHCYRQTAPKQIAKPLGDVA